MSRLPKNQVLPPAPDGEKWRVITHQLAITSMLLCASGELVPLRGTVWTWDISESVEDRVSTGSMGVRLLGVALGFLMLGGRKQAKPIKFVHVKVSGPLGRHWGDRVRLATQPMMDAVLADLRDAQETAARLNGTI